MYGELPLTGVLPSRDSEIRGAIMRIAKTNVILKRPVNKLFLIENSYQESTKQVWQGNKKQEAAVVGELKRKHEC